MLDKAHNIFIRLFLLVTAVTLTGLALTASPPKLLAQEDNPATAVSPITLNEPTLTPPLGTGQFPDGWIKVVGKSPQIIYLTANGTTADGIGGDWQPELLQAGAYRVEVYIGVNEFREYALLFPEQLAGLEQLTHSAQYIVNTADGATAVTIDQDLRESGWVTLGEFAFRGSSGEGVTLSNLTDEAAGTAVLALSAARFTYLGESVAATPTPPPTATNTPIPTDTPTATAVPPTSTPLPEELNLLDFGEAQISAAATSEAQHEEGIPPREEASIPLSINGMTIGRMLISYPTILYDTEADDIRAAIIITESFTDTLTVTLEDVTANQELGTLPIRREFFLTLDAAAFDFDDFIKTQKLTIQQNSSIGAAWNVQPKIGRSGRQAFNIKVILSLQDGIPEISGDPPTLYINVRQEGETVETQPANTPTPVPAARRIFNNLIDNTAVLIGTCLSFLVGILGVIIAYLNYRKDKDAPPPPDAPAVLDSDRQLRLHRWLDDYFSDQELRTLCLEMGVDYDDLRFSGQSAKARELVGWCARNGRLDDLEAVIQQQRPNLPE